MQAAIYARISQDRVGAGLGVTRQREDCESLIAARGWSLAGVYQDNDISAYSGKHRPGYRSLLQDIEAGTVEAVVAWHTDRLHRSPRELEEWIDTCERHGVATVTVRAGELDLATAAGRMVARMLGAAARHESEQKSERVRRAREQAAMAGRNHGHLGYGYRRGEDGTWSIEPTEAAIICDLAQRVLDGESLYSLAAELNARIVPSPGRSANGWRAPNLRQMLLAGRLCGWREWRPVRDGKRPIGPLVAQGDWPAILTREETEALRTLLTNPARRTGRVAKYLLSGLLRCGNCGGPLTAHSDRGRGCLRYTCSSQPGLQRCGRLSVSALPLEQHVVSMLFAALTDADWSRVDTQLAQPDDPVLGQLAQDKEMLKELADDLAHGRITREEWLLVRRVVADRIEVRELTVRNLRVPPALRDLPRTSDQLQKRWPTMTLDEQRTALLAVFRHVTVLAGGRPGPVFRPERVKVEWRV